MANSSFQVSQEFWKRLVSVDTTTRIEWLTPWLLATGVDVIREVIKGYNTSNLNFAMYIQTAATRTNVPNAPNYINGSAWSSGENNPGDNTVSTITNGTQGALWFRLGVGYASSTTGSGTGDVSITASWKQVADLLDTTTVQLEANDAGSRFAVLSRWIPAIWVTKFKVGLLATGVTGSNNLQFQLVVQGASTSQEDPSAWNTSFDTTGWRALSTSSNYEQCTAELSLPSGLGSPMWVRVGVMYALTTGSTTLTGATLTATVTYRGN